MKISENQFIKIWLFTIIGIFILGITSVVLTQKPQLTYSEQLYQEFHCTEIWTWINKTNPESNKVYLFKACGDTYTFEHVYLGKTTYTNIKKLK
jgi:hypothetical protein